MRQGNIRVRPDCGQILGDKRFVRSSRRSPSLSEVLLLDSRLVKGAMAQMPGPWRPRAAMWTAGGPSHQLIMFSTPERAIGGGQGASAGSSRRRSPGYVLAAGCAFVRIDARAQQAIAVHWGALARRAGLVARLWFLDRDSTP
jgi:hypothetical protein